MKKILSLFTIVVFSFLLITPVKAEGTVVDMIKDVEGEQSAEGHYFWFTLSEDLDLSKGAKLKISIYTCAAGEEGEEAVDPRTSDKCKKKDNVGDIYVNASDYYFLDESDLLKDTTSLKAGDKITVQGFIDSETGWYPGDYDIDLIREDGSGMSYQGQFSTGIYKSTSIEAPKEDIPDKDVVTEVPVDSKITSEMLSQIIKDKNKVTYETKDNDKLMYSWTFDGAKMTSSDYNIDLKVNVGSSANEAAIKAAIPNTKDTPLYLQFNHHGNLPENTTVKVNVLGTYKDGEVLTLYYYNEETKKLEEVSSGISVKDGFVEFNLAHCSDYVLVKDNKAPNNAQTSSLDIILYGTVAGISFIGIVGILIANKKKRVA